MQPKCIDAVNKSAGRALSASEINQIEDRVDATMRRLSRQDPKRWAALTRSERINEATSTIVEELKAEAQRHLANGQRQVLSVVETNNRIDQLRESFNGRPGHDGTRVESLKRDLLNTSLYMSNVRDELKSMLINTISAATSKDGASFGRRALQFVFDVENPAMTRDLAREIFANADGHTGNALAKQGARAWLDTIEAARLRFNAAGGDVRELGYGYVPQAWDSMRVFKAGYEEFAKQLLPHVDRTRYVNPDGTLLGDEELLARLSAAGETIAREGQNKIEPGQYRGPGKMANRGQDAREIHFKDGQSYLTVMEKFGAGSMYEAMLQHIGSISRRIALVERYGPDPAAQMRMQYDTTAIVDQTKVEDLAGAARVSPQTYWKLISGETSTPVNLRIANVGYTLRSLQIAGKLGWALWSSVNDIGNVVITAGYNRLPYWDLIRNVAAQGSQEGRDFMTAHGMIADAVASRLDQWSADHLASNWSGHLANATLRLSLLSALTDSLRQGLKLTLAGGLARMAKMPWAQLAEFDRVRLTRVGITPEDWAALMQVKPDRFRGAEVITPETITQSGLVGAPQLAARIFAHVQHECEIGVIEGDLTAKAITTGGGIQSGTYSGEILRTLMQFKSFPIAMITKHWQRFLEGDHNAAGAPLLANRYLYGTALLASSLALGGIGEQIYQVMHGKDPIDPQAHPKFWLRAMMRGGGLSIAGDMLLMDTTAERSTQEALGRMALGPSFGTVADVWELTKGNVDEYLAGKDTHAGAEAVRLGKSLMPVANVWWVQPLIDHGLLSALNENLSPGYYGRVKARAAKEWGQHYWWAPDEQIPERAPDLGIAFGQ